MKRETEKRKMRERGNMRDNSGKEEQWRKERKNYTKL